MASTIDSRYIVVGQENYIAASNKPERDVYQYTFDFTAWLDGDTILPGSPGAYPGEQSAIVGPVDGAPTVSHILTTASIIKANLAGGTSGWKGFLVIRALTVAYQSKRQKLAISITSDNTTA